jgi:hypothetical protein
MPIGEFEVQIMEMEVVVRHVRHGHTYRFPIVDSTTVGLRAKIEPNPKARRPAHGYLLEAHQAASRAFE